MSADPSPFPGRETQRNQERHLANKRAALAAAVRFEVNPAYVPSADRVLAVADEFLKWLEDES